MRNQKFLRLISVVLAIACVAVTFIACKPTDQQPVIDDTIPMPSADLKLDGNYKVIRGENAVAFERTAATAQLNGINSKTGLSLSMADDWVDADRGVVASDTEVLVGRTNREESIAVYDKLRADDYAVTVINKKVVIAALTEEKLNEAVAYFTDKLQADGTFRASDATHAKGSYSVERITVGGALLSKYKIVYQAGATDAVKAGAELLSAELAETFGYMLQVVNDKTAETQYEIVFGATNRGDSEAVFNQMGTKNYSVSVKDGKIYLIPGANEATPEAAVNGFTGKLAELCTGGSADLTADNFRVSFESNDFAVKTLTLNGVAISEYTIIYNNEDVVAKKFAHRIQSAIDNISGCRVNVETDSKPYSSGKEILLGYSKRMATGAPAESIGRETKSLANNNMLMFSEGDFFFMGGKNGNMIALMAATNRLIDTINEQGAESENVALTFESKDPIKPTESKYRIMTYNDGDNSWRAPSLSYRVNVIKEFEPDLVGMQEVERQHAEPSNPIQLSNSYKKSLGDKYGIVYFDHEQPVVTVPYGNMILYKLDKFELLDSGVQWLSDTPDEPNSMYDATDYIRTYVYAVLKDKATGEEIVFISTHVDYIAEANTPQMNALIKCTEKFRDKIVIFTGDFNMQRYADGFKAMYDAGYVESGVYMNPQEGGHIDFIFSDPSQIITTYYRCINDHVHSAGKPQAGSDHHPYIADLVIAR